MLITAHAISRCPNWCRKAPLAFWFVEWLLHVVWIYFVKLHHGVFHPISVYRVKTIWASKVDHLLRITLTHANQSYKILGTLVYTKPSKAEDLTTIRVDQILISSQKWWNRYIKIIYANNSTLFVQRVSNQTTVISMCIPHIYKYSTHCYFHSKQCPRLSSSHGSNIADNSSKATPLTIFHHTYVDLVTFLYTSTPLHPTNGHKNRETYHGCWYCFEKVILYTVKCCNAFTNCVAFNCYIFVSIYIEQVSVLNKQFPFWNLYLRLFDVHTRNRQMNSFCSSIA